MPLSESTHTGIDWNKLTMHGGKSGLAAEALVARSNPYAHLILNLEKC
jgi:hypothetical protein